MIDLIGNFLIFFELKLRLNLNKNKFIKIYTTGRVDEFLKSSTGFFDYTDLVVEHIIIK